MKPTFPLSRFLAFGLLLLAALPALAENAPIRIERTNDLCFIDEQFNCLPVDYTYIGALQPAGAGVTVQWMDQFGGWHFFAYWSPAEVAQEAYVYWLTPVADRQPALMFRAVLSEGILDFCCPFENPPGSFEIHVGTRKPPRPSTPSTQSTSSTRTRS